jgi:erythromycin esterase-like protein
MRDDPSAAIATVARPIRGESELDQLVELVGNARLILIGEASHGSHEFYDLRASLTRKLISQRGFAGVAIEGDWPDALRVDRYVRQAGHDESAADALGAFERFPQWMWRNADVASFVHWLHGWNAGRAPDQRAGFYGLDLYSLHASINAVLAFLAEADPEAERRARERYACFDHAHGDPQRYGMEAQLGLARSCEDEVVEQLVEMQRRHAARSGRTPRGEGWFQAMQHAHVVRDAEAYYRAMFGGRSASWNLRDTHMADTLDLLAAQLGAPGRPARLVVWAHNSHVGDARATAMGEGGELTLGQLMRQRHPGEVSLIGMTTHTGTVRCAADWDEPTRVEQVRPSLAGSWEDVLHGVELPRFYVTASGLRRVATQRERLHRAIGVIYRPETERRSHYYHARLAEQFDVVIHVDETHALRTLDRPMATREPAHELPETFPTGI